MFCFERFQQFPIETDLFTPVTTKLFAQQSPLPGLSLPVDLTWRIPYPVAAQSYEIVSTDASVTTIAVTVDRASWWFTLFGRFGIDKTALL